VLELPRTVDVAGITTTLVEISTSLEESGPAGVVLGATTVVMKTTVVETTTSLEVVLATGAELVTPVDNETPVESNTLVLEEDSALSEELTGGGGAYERATTRCGKRTGGVQSVTKIRLFQKTGWICGNMRSPRIVRK
jgi:hypothetical protein